jgi:hypothetical protein
MLRGCQRQNAPSSPYFALWSELAINVRPAERPVHLLALDPAPARDLVDGRFDESRADRFPLPVRFTLD